MLFMVEVPELGPTQLDSSRFGTDFGYGSQRLDVNTVPITLNLGWDRQHVWSREEDLKEFINSGLHPIEEKAQYRMMPDAFVSHKQDLAYLDSLNRQNQSANSSHGFHIRMCDHLASISHHRLLVSAIR